MSFERKTFKQLTAPGYFDFSAQQTAKTAQIIAWFDAVTEDMQSQINLYDLTFRLWASRDYTGVTPSQQLYLYYLSQSINFAWIQNNLNTERDLLSYLLAPRPPGFSECISQFYNLLVQIGWAQSFGRVIAGKGAPILYAETLIIFSNSPYVPSTPGNTLYVRRNWAAPEGWTRAPASSTYLCRGYLYNDSEIIWLPPVSTAISPTYYDVALLADLPGSATNGDICGVFDDGSGDQGAIYVWSDGNWYKCTTENSLQGDVFTNTNLDSGGLWAPDDPTLTAQTPPPVSGPSKGYGFYGLWGVDPTTETVELVIVLTDAGFANLGIIIQLLRKIKPFFNRVVLYYTYNNTVTTLEIKDSEAIY